MEIKKVIARFRFSALGNPEYRLKQILWSFGTKFVQRNYLYFQNWILKNHCPIGNHHPYCFSKNTLTHRLLFNTKYFEVLGPYLLQRYIFGMTFKRKMANAESAPLKNFIWRVSFKTKYFAFYGHLLHRKGTLVMEFLGNNSRIQNQNLWITPWTEFYLKEHTWKFQGQIFHASCFGGKI